MIDAKRQHHERHPPSPHRGEGGGEGRAAWIVDNCSHAEKARSNAARGLAGILKLFAPTAPLGLSHRSPLSPARSLAGRGRLLAQTLGIVTALMFSFRAARSAAPRRADQFRTRQPILHARAEPGSFPPQRRHRSHQSARDATGPRHDRRTSAMGQRPKRSPRRPWPERRKHHPHERPYRLRTRDPFAMRAFRWVPTRSVAEDRMRSRSRSCGFFSRRTRPAECCATTTSTGRTSGSPPSGLTCRKRRVAIVDRSRCAPEMARRPHGV